MKLVSKNTLYLIFVFLGVGILLFKDVIEGKLQIVLTIVALLIMMFGLYKVTSSLTSNKQKNYGNEEYFNREKYSQQEEE